MIPSFCIRSVPFYRSTRARLAAAGLLLGLAGNVHAQIVVDNPRKRDTFNLNKDGETLTIQSNVKFEGIVNVNGNNVVVTNNGSLTSNGAINVNGNNVVVTNNGTIDTNGFLTVASGTTGTVINNLGAVSSQNVTLNAPTTVNNGSATNTSANWSGYVGPRFTAPITINNYAAWSAQIQNLPNSTINNMPTGTWSAYMTPTGTTVINNSGAWSANDLNYSGSLTINHTAGGTWTANLNPGTALAINNSGTWTKGFNFPSTGPNRFINTGAASFNAPLGTGGGSLTITNSGTMNMNGGLGNLLSGAVLTNNRGATFQVNGQFVNAGQVSNAGTIASGDFNNSGTITGPAAPQRGSFTASGYTQNMGTFGVTGWLDFCDAGRPSTGFDARSGPVGPNTTFCSLAPLPVELVSFQAEPAKSQVQLRWVTASERNSARFVVERSAKGEVFVAVASVAAQGNAVRATAYAATDARPLPGTSYYRLRQIDLDGTEAFSPVVTVSLAASAARPAFYPNPATDRLTLDLSAAPAAPCTIRIMGLTGQVALTQQLAGGAVRELPLAGLPAGLYLLHIGTAQGSTVQRLEKR